MNRSTVNKVANRAMSIRYLVKLELVALFLSLFILSSFVQFRLPFISVVPPQLPDTWFWAKMPWFYLGTYSGNLQLPMYFLCLTLLDGTLATLTLGLYLLMGLTIFPIFYYGGGPAYFSQPTFGYLAILLPAAWLWMLTLRRHPRRMPKPRKYISASLISLGLIQLFGGLYVALYYQLIPFEFILSFVVPQLTWQIPAVLFAVLLPAQIQDWWRQRQGGRKGANKGSRNADFGHVG